MNKYNIRIKVWVYVRGNLLIIDYTASTNTTTPHQMFSIGCFITNQRDCYLIAQEL